LWPSQVDLRKAEQCLMLLIQVPRFAVLYNRMLWNQTKKKSETIEHAKHEKQLWYIEGKMTTACDLYK